MRSSAIFFVLAAACGPSQRPVVTLEAPEKLPDVRPVSGTIAPPSASPMPSLSGVSPGMTVPEVLARLGVEAERRTHDETEQWWTGAGYDPKIELPFILGFDQEISINAEGSDKGPAWNVYFADGRAVLFKVALFDHGTENARFGFPPSCFIGADASTIAESFGTPDAIREKLPRRFHYYLRRGVMVMEESGKVEVLDFFLPLDPPRAAGVAQLVMRP